MLCNIAATKFLFFLFKIKTKQLLFPSRYFAVKVFFLYELIKFSIIVKYIKERFSVARNKQAQYLNKPRASSSLCRLTRYECYRGCDLQESSSISTGSGDEFRLDVFGYLMRRTMRQQVASADSRDGGGVETAIFE